MNKKTIKVRRLSLSVLAIIFLAPLLIFALPVDEQKKACGSVEWEFQEAFECMANPNMWKRWDEIGQAYDSDPKKSRGEIGCPIYIEAIEKYNLTGEDKALFIYIAETNGDIDIKNKFQATKGQDFCTTAQERGWIGAYLKNLKH